MGDLCPAVTVLMGTFQSEAFVENSLRSLMEQDYPNLRIVVCDDASNDKTFERCLLVADGDPRVDVQRNPRNLGWVANYRKLLDGVDTAYVVFAFHDDILETSYIRKAVECLESNPTSVVAYSDLHQRCPRRERCLVDRLYSGPGSRFGRCRNLLLNRGHWWIAFRGVVRREAALSATAEMVPNHGGGVSADWFWCLKLASLGTFERIPEVLTFKNLRKEGVSQSWSDPPWRRLRRLVRASETVTRMPIPMWEKIGLLAFLPVAVGGTAWHAVHRRWAHWRSGRSDAQRGRMASLVK